MHQTRLFQHRLQKERPVCAGPRALSCALSSCALSSSTSCTAVCTSQPAKPQHKGHRLAAAVLLHSSYAGTHVSARAQQCCQPALIQHNTSHLHYGAHNPSHKLPSRWPHTCSGSPATFLMRRYACISSCATMLPISSRGRPYITSSTLTVKCCMGCMRGARAVLTLLTAPAWPALLRTTDGIVLQQ